MKDMGKMQSDQWHTKRRQNIQHKLDAIIDAIRPHSLSEIMKDSLEKMTKEYENRKFKSASK